MRGKFGGEISLLYSYTPLSSYMVPDTSLILLPIVTFHSPYSQVASTAAILVHMWTMLSTNKMPSVMTQGLFNSLSFFSEPSLSGCYISLHNLACIWSLWSYVQFANNVITRTPRFSLYFTLSYNRSQDHTNVHLQKCLEGS